MSNKPTTLGTVTRLPVIPFKRVFKDSNRYNRKRKHKDRSDE